MSSSNHTHRTSIIGLGCLCCMCVCRCEPVNYPHESWDVPLFGSHRFPSSGWFSSGIHKGFLCVGRNICRAAQWFQWNPTRLWTNNTPGSSCILRPPVPRKCNPKFPKRRKLDLEQVDGLPHSVFETLVLFDVICDEVCWGLMVSNDAPETEGLLVSLDIL